MCTFQNSPPRSKTRRALDHNCATHLRHMCTPLWKPLSKWPRPRPPLSTWALITTSFIAGSTPPAPRFSRYGRFHDFYGFTIFTVSRFFRFRDFYGFAIFTVSRFLRFRDFWRELTEDKDGAGGGAEGVCMCECVSVWRCWCMSAKGGKRQTETEMLRKSKYWCSAPHYCINIVLYNTVR